MPISTNVIQHKFGIDKRNVRLKQIVEGIKKLFDDTSLWNDIHDKYNTKIIIIDNTTHELPKCITKHLPSNLNVSTKLYINNKFGSINKGAGVIQQWKSITNELNDADWIIHFEPRQLLANYHFFTKFLKHECTIVSLWKKRQKHYYTGLFSCRAVDLLRLINDWKPKKMVLNNTNLESAIFKTFNNIPDIPDILILNNVGVFRFATHSHNKILN